MALGKQAKVVKRSELTKLLDHVSRSRHPYRDRVIVLLSFKAGLRAKEIAELTWSMVTDASGEIADVIALTNSASKGRNGGRTIPLHPDLRSQSRCGSLRRYNPARAVVDHRQIRPHLSPRAACSATSPIRST